MFSPILQPIILKIALVNQEKVAKSKNQSMAKEKQENKNQNANKPLIGISIGDINGINFELIIKTFQDERVLNYCTPIIYASSRVANYHSKALDYKNVDFNTIQSPKKANSEKLNLINAWQEEARVELGQIKEEAGKYAYQSLKACTDDLQQGLLDGMVTCPINKHTIQSQDFDFPGHTEFLEQKFGSEDTAMVMIHERIKIGVVTGHIPFNAIGEKLTQERIVRKIKTLNDALVKDFTISKPKIAVLGLNPHAGDQGLLGNEEEELITPAIEEAKSEGYLAFGPFPADGFFGSKHFLNFDGSLAQYHDQGLAPFKALTFGEGVNYTAGLPIVRTSPDHGPGYALAGKGEADENSFRQALFKAIEIIQNRRTHSEITANPLKNRMVKEQET